MRACFEHNPDGHRTNTVPLDVTAKRTRAPQTYIIASHLVCPANAPPYQALPVVVASLRLMCRSPACVAAAWRSGSFCHVQQSLLSDAHRHERAYLEDTKGALDVLAERLAIRFVEGSEKVGVRGKPLLAARGMFGRPASPRGMEGG